MNKKPTSHRLSEEARRMLEMVAKKLSISQTAVLEIAIREKTEKEFPMGQTTSEK